MSKKRKFIPSIPFDELIEASKVAPITYILKGARAMGSRDYAILHYYNKKSKHYKDGQAARHALRREIANYIQMPVDDYFTNKIEFLIDSLEISGYKFRSERRMEALPRGFNTTDRYESFIEIWRDLL